MRVCSISACDASWIWEEVGCFGLFCRWHCWGLIKNSIGSHPNWSQQHCAKTHHLIRFALSGAIICFSNRTHLQLSSVLCFYGSQDVFTLPRLQGFLTYELSTELKDSLTTESDCALHLASTAEWGEKHPTQVHHTCGRSFKSVRKAFQVMTSWSSEWMPRVINMEAATMKNKM